MLMQLGPCKLYRKIVVTAGSIEVTAKEITVHLSEDADNIRPEESRR